MQLATEGECMKDYIVSEKPTFSEKIKIVEVTDPVHADNANAAAKQLIENDIALKKMLENKAEPEEGMGFSHNDYTDKEKAKLAGIDEGANNYNHPASHPASMIEEDSTHRFVSDVKQAEWDAIYAQAVAYADRLIAGLVNGAPQTLDTLGEIANAMKENADVVTALQEAIGKKANEVELARVAFSGSYNDLADRPAALDGQDGTPAGFGIPTASVDDNTGTPSVLVTASGPDTAKVFHFEFRNIKGNTGAAGPAGNDGFSPTITENSGNNTETYKLDIKTKDKTFTTPNLIPNPLMVLGTTPSDKVGAMWLE